MAGFDYNNFTKDFSNRTYHNLKMIQKLANKQHDDPKYYDDSDSRLSHRGQDPAEIRAKKLKRWEKGIADLVHDPNYQVYEVTQLLLSVYGMLIIPYEKYKKNDSPSQDIPQALKNTQYYLSLKDTIKGLKQSGNYKSTYIKNDESVYEFIKHLRNSVSHEGIHFLPLTDGNTEQITEVLFYDFIASKTDGNGGIIHYTFDNSPERFCVKLSIKELREIVEQVTEMYSELSEQYDKHDEERYRQQIAACDSFLRNGI